MSTNTKPEKLECRVKIGSAYEPKWFERRYTQGTYSAKNAPLDQDAMGIQSVLLNSDGFNRSSTKFTTVVSTVGVLLLCAWVIWAMNT